MKTRMCNPVRNTEGSALRTSTVNEFDEAVCWTSWRIYGRSARRTMDVARCATEKIATSAVLSRSSATPVIVQWILAALLESTIHSEWPALTCGITSIAVVVTDGRTMVSLVIYTFHRTISNLSNLQTDLFNVDVSTHCPANSRTSATPRMAAKRAPTITATKRPPSKRVTSATRATTPTAWNCWTLHRPALSVETMWTHAKH